jgi:tetratricopeptide (TPR) repeat protein
MRIATLIAFAGVFFAAQAAAETVTVFGDVDQVGRGAGSVVFHIYGGDIDYEIGPLKTEDQERFLDILRQRQAAIRMVVVHVDPLTGHFEQGSAMPTFPVTDLTIDGKSVPGIPTPNATDADPIQRKVAAAMVYRVGLNAPKSVALFDDLLQDASVPAGARFGLLQMRGQALSQQALEFTPPGPERDRLVVKALSDFIEVRKQQPDSNFAQVMMAQSYLGLGAYDEARQIYKAKIDRGDFDRDWSLIMLQIVDRAQDRFDAGLADLDSIPQVARGMPYYYHRGVLLYDAGRFDEASAVLADGLSMQPDYVWANAYRACALASGGRLDDAVGVQQTVVDSFTAEATAGNRSPSHDHDAGYAATALANIQAARAKDAHAKLPRLCDGYWSSSGEKRERTTLPLPQP